MVLVTLKQAYDLFLKHGSVYWSPNTMVYYRRNLGYFVQYAEKILDRSADEIPIGSLPKDILVQYVVWLRAKTRYDSHPLYDSMDVSGTIKSNTVNSYVRAAKAFFNFLLENEYTDIRFTKGLRLPKSDSDQIVPLLDSEVKQIDAMFDPAAPDGLRNLCIIHLMLDAGLRACEVTNLTGKDLLFTSSAITINRSKGNRSRVVIMCPSLAAMLRKYIDLCDPAPAGPLFARVNGISGISHSVLRSLFLRIRKETRILRIHPHLLRHTFATSYIMGGGNLEALRILLGHYDYTVTRNYLHLASQYQIMKSPIYKLDPVFFEKGY